MSTQFANPADALNYLKAGKATITAVSTVTGSHYVYDVKRAKNSDAFYVAVHTGNGAQYLGMIFDGEKFVQTAKSALPKGAKSAKAFGWMLRNLRNGSNWEQIEVRHSGRCGRCSRELTDPVSQDRGIGPVCFAKMGG